MCRRFKPSLPLRRIPVSIFPIRRSYSQKADHIDKTVSKRVAIAIIGATAFTLAGCRGQKIDAAAFMDVQKLQKKSVVGAEPSLVLIARTAFAEAEDAVRVVR